MHDCAHLFARATIYFARIVKVMPIFALPERRWHGMSLTGPRPPGVKSPEHAVVRAGLMTLSPGPFFWPASRSPRMASTPQEGSRARPHISVSPHRLLCLLNHVANVVFSYSPIGHDILNGLVNQRGKECPYDTDGPHRVVL
jgi:hypothetical protein